MAIDSLKCGSCGQALSDGEEFCTNCGAKVAGATCPHCEKRIPVNSRFCRSCGKPVSDGMSKVRETLDRGPLPSRASPRPMRELMWEKKSGSDPDVSDVVQDALDGLRLAGEEARGLYGRPVELRPEGLRSRDASASEAGSESRAERERPSASVEEKYEDEGREEPQRESRERAGRDAREAVSGAPSGGAGTVSFALSQLQKPPSIKHFLSHPWPEITLKPEQVSQIVAFVFHSPHVQGNQHYRSRAASTSFTFDSASEICDEVNAFATDSQAALDALGMGAKAPAVVLFGGLVRSTTLCGCAIAAESTRKKRILGPFFQHLGKQIIKGAGELREEAAQEIYAKWEFDKLEDVRARRMSQSFAVAMNSVIVAHELGHIALGHTLGQQQNMGVSRNQEREADLFASSVITTSPFAGYIVPASVCWWCIMAWVDHSGRTTKERTHPFAEDRLFAFLRDNREDCESLRLTEKVIRSYLPPKK